MSTSDVPSERCKESKTLRSSVLLSSGTANISSCLIPFFSNTEIAISKKALLSKVEKICKLITSLFVLLIFGNLLLGNSFLSNFFVPLRKVYCFRLYSCKSQKLQNHNGMGGIRAILDLKQR